MAFAINARTCITGSTASESATSPPTVPRRLVLAGGARLLLGGVAAGLGTAAAGGSAGPAAATSPNYLRAYFRYAPRVERGRDFYVMEVFPLVESGDWQQLLRVAFTETSDARKGSAKAEYGHDRKVNELQRSLFDPMDILASTLGDKKHKVLMPYIDDLRASIDVIERVALGKVNKIPKAVAATYDPSVLADPSALAMTAWERGRLAINDYVDNLNSGLGRDVNKLQPVPDSFRESYTPAGKRPTPYGTF